MLVLVNIFSFDYCDYIDILLYYVNIHNLKKKEMHILEFKTFIVTVQGIW